jgi:eukaryotic-like serine/threonine-protein kinase
MLYISSGMAKVPNVSGQQQEQAVNQLKAFTVVVQQETSDNVAAGLVTRTDPGAGATLAQKGNITVYVSQGKPKVTVPNIDTSGNTTVAQVRAALKAAGLSVNPESGNDNSMVIGISPAAGTQVTKGDTISLSIEAPAAPLQTPGTDQNATIPGTGSTGGTTSPHPAQ